MKGLGKLRAKSGKAICLLLTLVLLFSLCACSSASSPQPSVSNLEEDVPYPRTHYYVLYSPVGKNGDLCYIPLSENEAELCRSVFSESEKESVKPEDVVSLFRLELDSELKFTVYESLSGGHFFSSGYRADEVTELLLDKIEKASGQDAHTTLLDFKAASQVELIKDGEILWSTEDETVITEIDSLLDSYIGSGASNFDNYDYELKCYFADGSERTLLLSSDDGFIFVPPLRYYKLPKLSPLRTDGWLAVFGGEAWLE